MARFSERQKQKVKKNKASKGINYALGCVLVIIILPICVFGAYALNAQQQNEIRANRIKTQYQEGLQGSINKNWVLIGHEFENKNKFFTFTVTTEDKDIPDNLTIQYRKKDAKEFLGEMKRYDANIYKAKMKAEDFGSGVWEFEAVATHEDVKGKKWTSTLASINISYALYIVWTMDWEGMAVSQGQLDSMSRISDDHHRLPIVHFFNPRIFVSQGAYQADYKMNYVKSRRDNYGDEIGVHIHAWFDLIRAAGVTPRSEPAWNAEGNVTGGGGYDVPVSAYPYDEFKQVLSWSRQKFIDNGLGDPISFRAGGWYLDLENVHALQDTGFKVDSSGRDARFWGKGKIASPWSLGSRTQPYKISTENLNSDYPPPRYDVWEMPNNAADSYWFSAETMIISMNDNFQDKPLPERRLVVVLSHPHWFNIDYPKLQVFYDDADTKYYPEDKGPILYSTLADYYEIISTDQNSKYAE